MRMTLDMIKNKNLKRRKPIMPDKKFVMQVLKLVVPIILGQIVISAVNFVDNFIVGHTNDSATNLSGVAMANEIWYFCFAFIGAISLSSSIFMAQYYGADKIDAFKMFQKNMMSCCLVVATIFTIIANVMPEKILGIYSSDPKIQVAGGKFLKWIIADLIFVSISYSFQTAFNIIGKTRYILLSASFALINNSVLGWALIYPANLGTEGAGIANFISRFFELAIMSFFAIRNKANINLIKWDIFLFDFKVMKALLSKWFYMLAYITFIFSLVAQTAVWSNFYSSEVSAAVGIGYAVSNIMWTIFPGISAATKNLVGVNLGKSDFDSALYNSRRFNVISLGIAFSFSTIAIALAFFLPQAAGLHGHSVDYAKEMILIFAGSNILYVITQTLFAALEAGNITLPSTIFYNFFNLVITLPLALLLAKFTGLEFWQVFFVSQIVQVIPAAISWYFYHQFKWLRNISDEKNSY